MGIIFLILWETTPIVKSMKLKVPVRFRNQTWLTIEQPNKPSFLFRLVSTLIVCTRLQAAPACLRHCQEEDKRIIVVWQRVDNCITDRNILDPATALISSFPLHGLTNRVSFNRSLTSVWRYVEKQGRCDFLLQSEFYVFWKLISSCQFFTCIYYGCHFELKNGRCIYRGWKTNLLQSSWKACHIIVRLITRIPNIHSLPYLRSFVV